MMDSGSSRVPHETMMDSGSSRVPHERMMERYLGLMFAREQTDCIDRER